MQSPWVCDSAARTLDSRVAHTLLFMYAPYDHTPPITLKQLLAGQRVADIRGNVGATREPATLQFRFETYNAFNHPQSDSVNAYCKGNTPAGTPCSGTANNVGNGYVNGIWNPRTSQVGMKLPYWLDGTDLALYVGDPLAHQKPRRFSGSRAVKGRIHKNQCMRHPWKLEIDGLLGASGARPPGRTRNHLGRPRAARPSRSSKKKGA